MPCRAVNKAFDADWLLHDLDARGATAVIPPKANRKIQHDYDAEVCKWRHLVANYFAKIKEFKGIAVHPCGLPSPVWSLHHSKPQEAPHFVSVELCAAPAQCTEFRSSDILERRDAELTQSADQFQLQYLKRSFGSGLASGAYAIS